MTRFLGVFGTVLLLASTSHAGVILSEILINPPGTDDGSQFVELRSDAGVSESLTDLSVVFIEGDGSSAGEVDQFLPLSGSTGSNGLFLWRDSATELQPPPDPATTVFVQDFDPDLEDPTFNIFLVSGFTGAIGDDLDSDDDGVLDVLPWTSVLDAVSATDGGTSDRQYAAMFGGPNFVDPGFDADGVARIGAEWIAFNVDGSSPGPFEMEDPVLPDGTPFALPAGGTFMTPGVRNIPEPSSLILMVSAALILLVRPRTR